MGRMQEMEISLVFTSDNYIFEKKVYRLSQIIFNTQALLTLFGNSKNNKQVNINIEFVFYLRYREFRNIWIQPML